jgi:hypothetical protein
MLDSISNDESLKRNALELVRQHRRDCNSATCNVSLYGIFLLLKRAGIKLTADEERRVFL